EIAIVLHDGEQVLDSFESLVNPECPIPYGITELTGISNEMVADAPRFYEIAKRVVEMTEGAVFVAHNVRFDYSFVQEEFKRLGFTYTRKQLCTVRLARKAFPGLRSYSLGNLIRTLNLNAGARHRAMGDTLATVDLFERIMRLENGESEAGDLINLGIKEALLPGALSLEKIHSLPQECGVYYFHDQYGQVVYVGKSINIQKRVASHFAKKTEKAGKLQKLVHDISYEVTGSELVSLLYESHEIKRLHPSINRAQKNRTFPWSIYAYQNQAGYWCFDVARTSTLKKKQVPVLSSFPSAIQARSWLKSIQAEHELCPKLCNLEKSGGPCFDYHLQKCYGACIGQEDPKNYNTRAMMAFDQWDKSYPHDNFIIVDRGREEGECALILVEGGKYQGWGFAREELVNGGNPDVARDVISRFEDNQEINRIVLTQLRKNKKLKVIPF
ncbi:MAG: DNA polymerase III subunit epsilon, partial [Bacteroidetes bacterium]